MNQLTRIAALPGSGGGCMAWKPAEEHKRPAPAVVPLDAAAGGYPTEDTWRQIAMRLAEGLSNGSFKLPDLRGHFIRTAEEREAALHTHDVTDPGQCHSHHQRGLGDPSHNHDYSGAVPAQPTSLPPGVYDPGNRHDPLWEVKQRMLSAFDPCGQPGQDGKVTRPLRTSHRLCLAPKTGEGWESDIHRDCFKRDGKVRFMGNALPGLWIECDEAHFGLMFDLPGLTF